MATLAEQGIDRLYWVYGRHAGTRALHAKGVVCRGRFTASAAGAALTRARHMQGEPVDAIVRFSCGSGDPASPDWQRDTCGIGVKFLLPDGTRTDSVAVTLPAFFVRTPEDFLALLRAQSRTARVRALRPLRQLLFVASHRESIPALRGYLSLKPAPSFANCRFNSLHAFRLVDHEDRVRYARHSWVPAAGEAELDRKVAEERGPTGLRDEILERLASEPVRFTLEFQLAEEGDPVDDPTVPWPSSRERVAAGTLEVVEPETERETGDDILVFDPTRVTDGIELSGDQILHYRQAAYSVSVERRTAHESSA
jgi:catalase